MVLREGLKVFFEHEEAKRVFIKRATGKGFPQVFRNSINPVTIIVDLKKP